MGKLLTVYLCNFDSTTPQNMKEEYGFYVWPCSFVLAEYVWQQKTRFAGANVVENDSVNSQIVEARCWYFLARLVAAKIGADVILTDDANRVEVLENIRRVCDLNNLNCNVIGLTWGVWDVSIFSLLPTIINWADVLYENSAFDDLFHRGFSPPKFTRVSFHNNLPQSQCEKLLDGFAFMPSHKASRLSGNIQLAEIVLSRQPIKLGPECKVGTSLDSPVSTEIAGMRQQRKKLLRLIIHPMYRHFFSSADESHEKMAFRQLYALVSYSEFSLRIFLDIFIKAVLVRLLLPARISCINLCGFTCLSFNGSS